MLIGNNLLSLVAMCLGIIGFEPKKVYASKDIDVPIVPSSVYRNEV